MTNLKKVLAANLRKKRSGLGITQARLAEKANVSTQYIAMIEIGRKFPSLEMMERLATALEIDILDFFSPPPLPAEGLLELQNTFFPDLEKSISKSVGKAVKKAISAVVASYTMTGSK